MKKTLLLILCAGFVVVYASAQNDGTLTYEWAKLTLKDGTVKEVVLDNQGPKAIQTGILCFDPKLLTAGAIVNDRQKQKIAPSELKSMKTRNKLYEVKKYADMSIGTMSSFGKFFLVEVAKSGKISLYRYQNEVGKEELLIGKQGEEKLKSVAATALMKYIEDIPQVKQKFQNGGYGNNPKNDNALFNDNLTFIEKLVDEYNEYAAFGRALTEEEKTKQRKINRSIIIDLWMNYELTEKNGNNAVILDYLPVSDKSRFKRIEMTSNYGGEDERTIFTYNANSELQQVVYRREDKQYIYDLNYTNGKVSSINVGGKKKIEFVYSYDTLKSIIREGNGVFAEYAFNYVPGEQKADVALSVMQKGKRDKSSSTYSVAWTNDGKLSAFKLDVYGSKDIAYAAHGAIESCTFDTMDGPRKMEGWEYTNDERQNWTERKMNTVAARRTIEYLAP